MNALPLLKHQIINICKVFNAEFNLTYKQDKICLFNSLWKNWYQVAVQSLVDFLKNINYRYPIAFSLYNCSAVYNIDGLAQHFSNSIANALELLQSCTKPSI